MRIFVFLLFSFLSLSAGAPSFDASKAAFVSGEGKGGVFYIFTDPDCPFCESLDRQLSKSEKSIKDIKLYTFLYPLEGLHPRSKRKCEYILSFPKEKRREVFRRVIGDTRVPVDFRSGVEEKISLLEMREIARGLGVNGTPQIFDIDGKEVKPSRFLRYIKSLSKRKKNEKL